MKRRRHMCKLKWSVWLLILLGVANMVQSQENTKGDVPRGVQYLRTIVLPASTSLWSGKIADLGIPKPVDKTKTETLSYWFFVPNSSAADSKEGLPLLLFLHGAGERGSNPNQVKTHGPPKFLDTEQAKTWPFITVSPQCPDGKYWSPQQLVILLNDIEMRFPVDRSRIYVTGLSMGGFGTWMLLNEAPGKFAAAMPVCGGGDPAWIKNIGSIPVWIHHGAADGVVPVQQSKNMFDAMSNSDGVKSGRCPQPRISIYPGVGHNSWVKAYGDSNVWPWLLSQKTTVSR